jgi:hypothetical protein
MHIDKSGDGEITEDEFIRIWIKCESSLKDKIRSNEQEIYAAEVAIDENVTRF